MAGAVRAGDGAERVRGVAFNAGGGRGRGEGGGGNESRAVVVTTPQHTQGRAGCFVRASRGGRSGCETETWAGFTAAAETLRTLTAPPVIVPPVPCVFFF